MKATLIHGGQVQGTLVEALALLEALPYHDKQNCQTQYVLGKIYKDLDEASPNEEHAEKAFYHLNNALGRGYRLAAFDLGELAEHGRGTEVNLVTAYTAYVMGSGLGRDERAIARVRELRAAGPPYTAELTVAVAQWNVLESREGPLNSETIDEALARIIGE